MKKYFVMLAAAMLLLPLACNKKNDDGAVVDLNKPVPTAEKAVSYTLDLPATPPKPEEEIFTEVIRTDDNTLAITAEKNGVKTCYSGPCVEVNANKWTMKDGADQFEVEIVEKKASPVYSVTVKHNGATYTATATPKVKMTTNPVLLTGIARKFAVKQTTISVQLPNNDKLAGAHSEDGCDLPKIAEYMKNTGELEFDYDFTGYVVKTLELDSFGNIVITFTGKPAYKGEFSIDNAGKFAYELDVKDEGDNPIFNGAAEGKISLDIQKGRVLVELAASGVSKKEEEYKAKVQLLLVPVTQ